ncbi:hsp90 co-chaperone Cdc37-like [Paramacrobiotus metropolitanus]|uniref:hsp90 co-chaperone Cdc37-like n=1 Tax=Paramacrobiotus metropolitanus TaxID=2943436 RepID=UPI0024463D53|nr:hsp90 co-chaperone Cdc37-like [Paramacrobiotus metropolitanus]
MVDYSKWKSIEVSDDEDDTHPNVDTGSLFRWRHQARVERMDEFGKRKQDAQEAYEAARKLRLEKQQELQAKADDPDLKKDLEKANKDETATKEKLDEVMKEEKKQAWNVDTISKPGFSKTIVNKPAKPVTKDMTDEEREQYYVDFVKKNEADIKKFAFFRNYDDSREFLQSHSELVCEETANYMVLMCLNLEMEQKHALMDHVAHQAIVMQFILELAKQLDMDPRACVSSFFSRIKLADKQYKDAFNDEYTAFKGRIQERARIRIQKAMEEVEEEERNARLGPGGLDPVEVMEELPEELRKCFESRDTEMLKEVLASLDKDKAIEYMDKCVKSGLWVPEGGASNEPENIKTTEAVADGSS